jgi:glutamate synthase (NADPH/NADH) small chain
MVDIMQRFVDINRAMPDKRTVDDRRADFDEIYRAFTPDHAGDQASRCEQCGIPFCQFIARSTTTFPTGCA